MSLISGVSLNQADGGAAAQQAAATTRGAGAIGRANASPTSAGGVLTGSQSINNVFFAISSMMQSIGGGIENDKLLRMLIALLIIMALLEQQQGESQPAGGQPGNGINGQGGSFSLHISSTTITMQESVVVFGNDASGAYDAQNQGATAPGSELDLSA